MKLQELKERVFGVWSTVCCLQNRQHDRVGELQNKEFRQTLRSFGDLRFKKTWETAFCKLYALVLKTIDEPQELIENFLIEGSREEGWGHLLRAVIAELLLVPGGQSLLNKGLDDLNEFGWFFIDEPSPHSSDTLAIIKEMVDGTQENRRQRLERSLQPLR